MKKQLLLLPFLIFTFYFFALGQNVGIGTTAPAPANRLHVHDAVNQDASIGITNSLTTNANLRGARLRMLNSDFILANNEASGKIQFANGGIIRMAIDANGNVGIGTTSPTTPLEIFRTGATINAYSQNTAATGSAYGFLGTINSDEGAGIAGISNTGGGSAAFFSGRYGVLGTVGFTGTAVAGYGLGSSTAIFGRNTDVSGYALRTDGRLQFNGIGEAANTVLTSDATGNASWQALPGGANAWQVSSSQVYRSTGNVSIGANFSAFARFHTYNTENNITARLVQTSTTNSFSILEVVGSGTGNGLAILKDGTAGDGINVDVSSIGQSAIYALNRSTSGGFGVVAESASGNSLEGRKNGMATGRTAYFQNTVSANASPTVEISSNGVGSKLVIGDNSGSANASLQINSNAANAVRVSRNGTAAGNGFYVDNQSSNSSSGMVAINYLNSNGTNLSNGVTAIAGDDGSGIYNQILTTAGVYAYNLNPGSGYGVYARSKGTAGAALLASYTGSGTGTAVEINNGYLKVSGATKTAFVHTATAANISAHITNLSYSGQAATDMLIVTPNYNPGGAGGTYNNHPIGVFWNGVSWTIFNQDIANVQPGTAFNVLVIKQ